MDERLLVKTKNRRYISADKACTGSLMTRGFFSDFREYMRPTCYVPHWYTYRSKPKRYTRIRLVRDLREACFELFHDVANDPLAARARVYVPYWSHLNGRRLNRATGLPTSGCLALDFKDPNDAFLFKMKYGGISS